MLEGRTTLSRMIKWSIFPGSMNFVEEYMDHDPGVMRRRTLARLRIRRARRFNKTRRSKLRILMLDSAGLACAF
ncbi:hypothetical protein Bca101_010404 [Brassica carinata]